MRRTFKTTAVLLALGWGFVQPVAAQTSAPAYPTKPIKMILPFPPGGSSDQIARLIAPIMSEKLGQPVIVENRPGAGGAIALNTVAKSAPDGHTIGIGTAGGLGINAVLTGNQPYDAIKDLEPITNMVQATFVLVTHPDFKPNTIREVIVEAKRKPGQLAIGHGGAGSMMHLATELFKHQAKADFTVVPYKGTAPATTDAMAGQITMAMSDIPTAISYIKSNRLKAIAVTSPKREPALPDVPTFAESGVPNYEATGWIGMVAPAGTPPAIIKRLNREIVAALKRPDVHEKVLASGYGPVASTPEELGQTMRSEIAKWTKLIKDASIKVE